MNFFLVPRSAGKNVVICISIFLDFLRVSRGPIHKTLCFRDFFDHSGAKLTSFRPFSYQMFVFSYCFGPFSYEMSVKSYEMRAKSYEMRAKQYDIALFSYDNGLFSYSFGTKIWIFGAESAIAEDERKESVSSKNDTRFQLIALMSQVRDALKAGLAPKKEYDLCGFDYRKEPATVIASDPTDLSGEGRSNGVNYLRWSGNNKTGTFVYELWRLHGDTAPWTLHATTKKQSYTDAAVTPPQTPRTTRTSL
jgi:hypothetical protein